MTEFPVIRDLDGVYFRVKRNEKWHNLCFSDLTYDEQKQVTDGRSVEWLQSLAINIANTVRGIGDTFDIKAGE